MAEFCYLDQKYETYEDAYEACKADLEPVDILKAIVDNNSAIKILNAILKGNESMFYHGVELAAQLDAACFITTFSACENCSYWNTIGCANPDGLCSDCSYDLI